LGAVRLDLDGTILSMTTNNQTTTYPIEERLKALIEQLDAYITHYHGGSVELVAFDGKTVTVHLGGACLGCPLSPNTVHGWVEGTVKQFFPEIEHVESV
jgi:Fe-S cluster biogenesis protein NfuA